MNLASHSSSRLERLTFALVSNPALSIHCHTIVPLLLNHRSLKLNVPLNGWLVAPNHQKYNVFQLSGVVNPVDISVVKDVPLVEYFRVTNAPVRSISTW